MFCVASATSSSPTMRPGCANRMQSDAGSASATKTRSPPQVCPSESTSFGADLRDDAKVDARMWIGRKSWSRDSARACGLHRPAAIRHLLANIGAHRQDRQADLPGQPRIAAPERPAIHTTRSNSYGSDGLRAFVRDLSARCGEPRRRGLAGELVYGNRDNIRHWLYASSTATR